MKPRASGLAKNIMFRFTTEFDLNYCFDNTTVYGWHGDCLNIIEIDKMSSSMYGSLI